jgi:hypothetical protein
MLPRTLTIASTLIAVAAAFFRAAAAESLSEHSAEVRLQLDFAVSDAAIRKVLPAGWETDVATSGGAKDCNLRMIFIDRVDVTGSDNAPKGANQLVILEVPVKRPGAGLAGRMIIDGLTSEAKDAPGPLGIYRAAASSRMERATRSVTGAPPQIVEDWDFTGPKGERMGLHLKYERGVARKGDAEIKIFSGANPSLYHIAKISQGLYAMRNATVPAPRDLVAEFQYTATGGNLGSLFDGKERVISVDSIQWSTRAIYLP